ncbi:MAG TPA: cytochrome c [Opitutaceae bacterium]
MREIIARLVCMLTVGVVVGLSLLFAAAHNPRSPAPGVQTPAITSPPPPAAPPMPAPASPSPATAEKAARGRAVYAQQGCATCHAVGGVGNPRHPLDGVGSRRDDAQLHAWVTGTGAAAETLSGPVLKRKQRYQQLPPGDLEALIDYLATLRAAPGTQASLRDAGGLFTEVVGKRML